MEIQFSPGPISSDHLPQGLWSGALSLEEATIEHEEDGNNACLVGLLGEINA